jgi:hypothetical protein
MSVFSTKLVAFLDVIVKDIVQPNKRKYKDYSEGQYNVFISLLYCYKRFIAEIKYIRYKCYSVLKNWFNIQGDFKVFP